MFRKRSSCTYCRWLRSAKSHVYTSCAFLVKFAATLALRNNCTRHKNTNRRPAAPTAHTLSQNCDFMPLTVSRRKCRVVRLLFYGGVYSSDFFFIAFHFPPHYCCRDVGIPFVLLSSCTCADACNSYNTNIGRNAIISISLLLSSSHNVMRRSNVLQDRMRFEERDDSFGTMTDDTAIFTSDGM